MKKEKYILHLKELDEIKTFDVEMQFNEDTEMDKFSMFIDGEKLELTGDTESIFIKLSRILGDKYEIHSCYTCKYGNFNPFESQDNEIFCINDFELKSKGDLIPVFQDWREMEKRKCTLFNLCSDFEPCSGDYWTYK